MSFSGFSFPGVRVFLFIAGITVTLAACKSAEPSVTSSAGQQNAENSRIIQPGAPGQTSTIMSADEASAGIRLAFTEADVGFMQGMIAHHAQALDMTALVLDGPDKDDRLLSVSDSDGLILLSKRISISQTSEIELMQKWLRDRDQVVPEATAHQMRNGEHILMPGMLTPDQMSELAASTRENFYGLFLDFMIGHHEGALVMVSDLMASVGSAQDTIIFRFATGVDVDQRMEIARMQDMIDGKY